MPNNSRDWEDEDGPSEQTPPQHLFSDYVEITYLGLVICAGLALNICVLKRLLRERRRAQRSNKAMSGFLLLKLNLNVSDILILLIHASGKLSWLITYEWRFGECLCRLFNLSSMFTLYLSSNIVICIALDRLFTVIRARRMDLGQRKLNLVRLMLTLAWTLSLLFSLPQLVVWTTYNPFRDTISQGWVQCTDIWSIDRYERFLAEQPGNLTPNGTNPDTDSWSHFILQPLIQNSYELTHLFLVFYGPLIALVFCYALISTRLIRFAANNPCSHSIIMPQSSNENAPDRPATVLERRQLFKRASVKSFPAVRLYSPIGGGGGRRRKSHHNHQPMVDIVEVSTRAEEPSNATQGGGGGVAEQPQQNNGNNKNKTQSMHNIRNPQEGATTPDTPTEEAAATKGRNLLVLLNGHHDSNTSLPSCALRSPSASGAVPEDFPGRSILLGRPSCCQSPLCRVSFSCSSSSSYQDLKRHSKLAMPQPQPPQASRRILVRIRDSFRESFGKRHHRRLHHLQANLRHCSSTNSLCDNGQLTKLAIGDSRGSWVAVSSMCPPLTNIMGRLKRGWCSDNGASGERVLAPVGNSSSSGGRRQRTSTTAAEIDGVSNPGTPQPHLPPSSSAYSHLQNGDAQSLRHKTSWITTGRTPQLSSVRSSFSTSVVSVPVPQRNGGSSLAGNASGSATQPLWRRHLRSRAFRTTLLVILVHILLWSPYNVYALMKHVNERLYEGMSERANILKDLQFLITLINPFLYGFGRSNGKKISGRRKGAKGDGRPP